MTKNVTAFTGLEDGSVMTLKVNAEIKMGEITPSTINITCEQEGWGGQMFAELNLSMGEAIRLRDTLDLIVKHEAANALHEATQQYNAAIDTRVNSAVFDCSTHSMEGLKFPSISMTDEFESQANSTPATRKALRDLITERAKEVRPDPKSQGAGKNPFANSKIRKWTDK